MSAPALSGETAAAIAAVREALLGDRGLAARLRAGQGLDRPLVARALEALALLTDAFSDAPTVPKPLAAALVDIQTPLEEAARDYPLAEQNAVEDAGIALVDAANALLETGAGRPGFRFSSETERVLFEGLISDESPQFKLRVGQGLDVGLVATLRRAFGDGIREWGSRTDIAKTIAIACVDLPWSMGEGFGNYDADQQARILEASAELTALARALLEGPASS